MTHCTVCGAAAREGAKFCTSCGARLVDTVATAPASDDTATVPVAEPAAEPGAPAASRAGEAAPESTWASAVTGTATGDVDSVPAERAEPETPVTPAEPREYTANWPAPGDEPGTADTDAGTAAPPAEAGPAWTSWASTEPEPARRDAPDSFATDADQDPESPRPETPREEEGATERRDVRPSPFATDADQDARSEDELPARTTEAPDRDAEPAAEEPGETDADHHGASAWESWAPTASGESTVPAASSDVGASVRRLLDDLANRIDRLIDPAPVAARGVDADELADQLARWSGASTDADGLLEVVRAVRRSPRDVDALTRLADRAPDLELLVRHYQAITTGAGDWSNRLREQRRGSTPEDA